MNDAKVPPLLQPLPAVLSPEQTLRRLFLTLFLRGRSARGLQKASAPKSVGDKLTLVLVFYALMGAMGAGMFAISQQPVFMLAAYLHAMTFVFLGMFVAASAGEILFNKEEGDILLHRPIAPQTILRAKIRVLVEVSLWIAGAFNLVGLSVGIFLPDGSWLFPVAHVISTIMEAFFCTGSVVLSYQLCLRWFGRERLDGLMTTAQIIMAVTFVIGGQILPRLLSHLDTGGGLAVLPLWVGLLPPAWFAGFDDAIAGSGGGGSWILAGLAVIATVIVLWLALGKLARDYETGLQTLSETVSTKARKPGRRWIDLLISVPPFRWWLREPVARASFLLTAAYLVRDRDTKLRVYPSLAPMLILPFVMLFQGHQGHYGDHFMIGLSVGFAGAIIATMPLQGLLILQYSQQWQAADIFHVAPMRGPAELSHGARRAVLCFLTFPLLAIFGLIFGLLLSDRSQLLLLLPSLIAMPVFALVPCLGNGAVPLSRPTEEAKSASRGSWIAGIMLISMVLSAVSALAWYFGFFWWLVLMETLLALVIYRILKRAIAAIRWKSLE